MKLSQVIEQLQELRELHGDVEVETHWAYSMPCNTVPTQAWHFQMSEGKLLVGQQDADDGVDWSWKDCVIHDDYGIEDTHEPAQLDSLD